jgi:hypothetical protein
MKNTTSNPETMGLIKPDDFLPEKHPFQTTQLTVKKTFQTTSAVNTTQL